MDVGPGLFSRSHSPPLSWPYLSHQWMKLHLWGTPKKDSMDTQDHTNGPRLLGSSPIYSPTKEDTGMRGHWFVLSVTKGSSRYQIYMCIGWFTKRRSLLHGEDVESSLHTKQTCGLMREFIEDRSPVKVPFPVEASASHPHTIITRGVTRHLDPKCSLHTTIFLLSRWDYVLCMSTNSESCLYSLAV